MKLPFICCGNTCCSPNAELLDAKVPQKDVGKLYDRTAWFYDFWAFLTESKAQKMALQIATIQDNSTILDVAVGTGRLFREIMKRNPSGQNYGIDISRGMLAKAKHKLLKQENQNYTLEIGSAFDINMDDDSVDILFNNYMFDLIPFDQMDDIIKEFKRVMKPDGKLVLVNMTKGEQFGAGLYERIYRFSPSLMGGCRGVQQSERLIRHGFQIKSREYVQQMLFPSEVILAVR